MSAYKKFIIGLFLSSVALAIATSPLFVWNIFYLKVFFLYLFFSILYYRLRIISRKGNTTIDYGINYSISFGIFATPTGLFLFELVHRFMIFVYKKWTKTCDPEEGVDYFYNVGSFVLQNSLAYLLYQYLIAPFDFDHSILYWLFMYLIVALTGLVSDLFLIIAFAMDKQITTIKESIEFIKTRSLLDTAKTSMTNGFLLYFLHEENWIMLCGLFCLNYLVSHSYFLKAQNIQNKLERDQFEQMAYTDYLTGSYNRAYMDKVMKELKQKDENIGIVVTDIDHFKWVNDNYNHTVGDFVIQQFVRTINSRLSGSDLLIRTGGEEFTIFLKDRTFEECLELVELIRQEIESKCVQFEMGDQPVSIHYTASFGLYYDSLAAANSSIEGMYMQADQHLLASKKLGRNRVTASKAY